MLSPPAEGYHIASRELIEAAVRAGINTHVMTIEPKEKVSMNWKNWTAINPYVNLNGLPSILSPVEDLFNSFKIVSHSKPSRCNLIHILNVNKEAYVLAHTLLKNKRPLLVHFYHSPHVLHDDVFLVRNLALKLGLYGRLLNNHVVTVNRSMFRFMTEKVGADPEQVHVVPYPVNTNRFRPLRGHDRLREKYHLPSDRFIIAYVGSIQPARGINVLLKALHMVTEKFPKALLLVCHPQRKEERAFERVLKRQIVNLKLERNVELRGLVDDVNEIYNLADIVVLPLVRPYWVDPPLVLLEAMSSSSAVVTTSVGALGEILDDHNDAVLAEPGDATDLSKAIIYLLDNIDEARKIGRNARKTIVRNYSYETVGKQLLSVYNHVLEYPA